jgi:hypothetical protein
MLIVSISPQADDVDQKWADFKVSIQTNQGFSIHCLSDLDKIQQALRLAIRRGQEKTAIYRKFEIS